MKKVLKTRLIIYSIFSLFTFSTAGQTGKFYSPDKDLSNSLINQIYQDKRGFIWIATENGLNKFDGTKFTIYTHTEDSTSLRNNYVRSVLEDHAGDFWVGCINGLMKYDRAKNSFSTIEMYNEGKIVTPHVTFLMESRNGDIWIATSGKGLFIKRSNDASERVEAVLTDELNNYLNLIFEDSNGNLWIGSEYNGINQYSPASKEIKVYTTQSGGISSNNISSIAEDRQGNIFVGTLTQGLHRFDKKNDTFRQVQYRGGTQLLVKSLFINKENMLYIGTDGQGLKVYDRNKNVVEDYEIISAPFDLSKGKIHSILQDKDNNLWFGVFQKGVIFIPEIERKFDYLGLKSLKNNSIGSSSVMSIYKDNHGITWIGTDSDGIYGINERDERISHFYQTASPHSISNIILSIYEDTDYNLWVGSYTKGLAKLDKRTGNCQYVKELLNEKIYCITEDNRKNLLVGTYGTGFYKLNLNNGKITHYESLKRENDDFSTDELSNDWINDILVDSDGLIWLAHYKGVSCFNPTKNTFINFFNQNTILPKTVAYTLYEDKSGEIWIGSSEGLYVFNKKNESFECYTTKDGLPNGVICGIQQDDDNNIWMSTYLGISKFNRTENRFINYYAGDGLQGNEFTRGAHFKDSNGRIYFGGIYGITRFYPSEVTDAKNKLKIMITDFYLFNHAVRQGDKSGCHDIITTSVLDAKQFTLSHNDNTFSIELSTLEYTNPERIVYQYMIEEFNSEWINSYPGINKVTYSNLNPGIYTFRFRALDHDNFSETKTIKIIIIPPWYRTIWAYLIYAFLLALFLYFLVNYVRSRIHYRQKEMVRKHQEQINEAKLQFFINISHEIRTPMTLIINPLEKLMVENKEPAQQKSYAMIYRNVQRILKLINQLMDIRQLEKGQMRLHFKETDIIRFIEEIMLAFEYTAQRKNICFDFIHHEYEELKVWIDLGNFDKILLNILSNAFKYTPDHGNITIELATGEDKSIKGALNKYFEISITDSGIGIDKDKIEQIFERFYRIDNDFTNSNFGTGIGLHLSRSLVELHHGVIFAENNEKAQGTRFVVRIPLGCDHLGAKELESNEIYKGLTSSTHSFRHPDMTSANEKDEEKKVRPKSRYKILIAEDEDEIRDYIKEELYHDYKIIEASNGKKALELALRESPDLIVSDIMMSEMDGFTLVQKVKQNININHIPIVLLTAKVLHEHRIEGLETGADAYISKPFNTELLKSTILNLIENRERLKNKYSGKQQPEDKISKIELKSADEILMQKVMKIINGNLSNPELNVSMLASNVGMSRVHIHRKLKELTNQSARDFIKGIRLKQAADLLSDKKYTISEVAYATGFSDLSHFSNSFRLFYGISPKEFAKKEAHTVNPDL